MIPDAAFSCARGSQRVIIPCSTNFCRALLKGSPFGLLRCLLLGDSRFSPICTPSTARHGGATSMVRTKPVPILKRCRCASAPHANSRPMAGRGNHQRPDRSRCSSGKPITHAGEHHEEGESQDRPVRLYWILTAKLLGCLCTVVTVILIA